MTGPIPPPPVAADLRTAAHFVILCSEAREGSPDPALALWADIERQNRQPQILSGLGAFLSREVLAAGGTLNASISWAQSTMPSEQDFRVITLAVNIMAGRACLADVDPGDYESLAGLTAIMIIQARDRAITDLRECLDDPAWPQAFDEARMAREWGSAPGPITINLPMPDPGPPAAYRQGFRVRNDPRSS